MNRLKSARYLNPVLERDHSEEAPRDDQPLIFAVTAEAEGERLDKFLAAQFEHLSRTLLQHAIASGSVLVNDASRKPGYRLRTGDVIDVELPEPPPETVEPEAIPLQIIYEDEHIAVVDKPAGMVVHCGAGATRGALTNALVYHFRELSSAGGRMRPGIVHRLDKQTSGIIVVAKTDVAHRALAEQFESRKVKKRYVALIFGHAPGEGEIDAPIGRDPHNRVKMVVRRDGSGRAAVTRYTLRERFGLFSLLDVFPKTGRTHQIRVHLAHIKHPVVGDKLYSAGRESTIPDAKIRKLVAGLDRQFLHAAEISIIHPATHARSNFQSPLPPELENFLASLRSGM